MEETFYKDYREVYTEEQKLAIEDEFKRLKGDCYLDHSGATLYSEKQIENITVQLRENIYSNPHSRSSSSKLTQDAIDIVRYQVLSHFNTNPDEYSVIFTSGATASLKLVAESFDYKSKGRLLYLQDNHTSVLGMRQFAKNSECLKLDQIRNHRLPNEYFKDETDQTSNSLFVYPSQSNYSGVKYPLDWINVIRNQSNNWFVLLDAASHVATSLLDLSKFKPDFVTLSFYKIFGYPSGLGALLIRNSSCCALKTERYYGGGTVLMVLSEHNVTIPRKILHDRFEDGTVPFLSIISLKEGFNTLRRFNLTFDLISEHTFELAHYVYRNLLCYHHSNGNPVVILYHDNFDNCESQGGIINFNLLRDNGEFVGYAEVLNYANLYGIHLRTGCLCNPGACHYHLKLLSEDVQRHFQAGHVCGDQLDLINGQPTGSVRISFGYMTMKRDADRFLDMIMNCFIVHPLIMKLPAPITKIERHTDDKLLDDGNRIGGGILEEIILYPVKSCGGFPVANRWILTSTGLKYDRDWMIVNSMGVCVTQKHNRKLCLITPRIDLIRRLLILTYPPAMSGHDEEFSLPLDLSTATGGRSMEKVSYICQSKVCGDQIQGWDCGDEISDWLSTILETPGLRLLRQCSSLECSGVITGRTSNTENGKSQLSLANKAQYLLINRTSVEWIRDRIPDDAYIQNEDISGTLLRFRPNFVIRLSRAFEEDECLEFTFDADVEFKVGGKCTRCQMICINQTTGNFSKEPLQTLSREFKGKICFGTYLSRISNKEQSLTVGCNITTSKYKI